jgi:hypothetical protein
VIDHQVGTNFVNGAQTDLEFRNAVRALAKSAKNYNIPTLITDSVPQGPNGHTMNWITELFPDHKVYHRDGVIDAFGYMPFADARMQLMGVVVSPWYGIAADWQKNWTLPGADGLGAIFTEHLVHDEYVGQAQRDNLAAAKAA